MMGRLIDEDVLLKAMDKRYKEKHGNVPDNLAEGFMQMEKLIKEQPTAYDVEKVIEQLNDLPTFKVSATSEKHPFCAYEAEMISKHKVMGIVKKGGAK